MNPVLKTTRWNTWTNQPLLLYHGTIQRYERSILSGVELKRPGLYTDFGPGFYTTTWIQQATEWAIRKALELGDHPSVIEFTVSRRDIAALSSLWFVRGQSDAEDYWRLVRTYRKRNAYLSPHNGESWYDVVIGPVSASWKRRTVKPAHDQVSFHTPMAVALLNRSTKRVMPDAD